MGLPRNRKMLPVCASREWFIQPTYLIKWSAYHRQGVQLNIWNLRIMWAKRRDITDVRRRVANHVIFRCFLNNAKYFLYNKSLKEGKYVGTKEIPLENKRGGGQKANLKPFAKWDANGLTNIYLPGKLCHKHFIFRNSAI